MSQPVCYEKTPPEEHSLCKRVSHTELTVTVSPAGGGTTPHFVCFEEGVSSKDDSPTNSALSSLGTISYTAAYKNAHEDDALSEEDARTKVTVASSSTMSRNEALYEIPPKSALANTQELGGRKTYPPFLKGDCFVDDDNENECNVNQRHYLDAKLRVISNVVFVVASAIYVAAEATYLPYYQFYKGVPYDVREAENDDVWWTYYNETDAFPDYLSNATDDYVWSEWFNTSFLDEEEEIGEFLFQVPNADRKYEVRSTRS
jgi:hypothetical protein